MNEHFTLIGDSENPYSARVLDADGKLVPNVYSYDVHASPSQTDITVNIGAAYEFQIGRKDMKHMMFTSDGGTIEIPDPRTMVREIELLKEIYAKAWEVRTVYGTSESYVFDSFNHAVNDYELFVRERNHGNTESTSGEAAIRPVQEEDSEAGRPPDQDSRVELEEG